MQYQDDNKDIEAQFDKNLEMIREKADEHEDSDLDVGMPPDMLGRGFTKVNELLAGIDLETQYRNETIKQSEFSEMPQYPS